MKTAAHSDLLLQVAHPGRHRSLLDSARELRKSEADRYIRPGTYVDLVNQCLELAVIQAVGEDEVEDLHHNRHESHDSQEEITFYVELLYRLFLSIDMSS